jgi:hypothetical protein
MAEHLSESERRDLAQAHRDEIDVESAVPVAPKRLGQMISLRLDPEIAIALRDLATERGASMSDLLREGAARVLAEASQSMQVIHVQFKVSHGISQQTVDPRTPTGSRALGQYSFSDPQVTAAA